MKFRQLIEYNMRNLFLEKSYTKCGRETISRPFSKKSELSISLDPYSKVLYTLFWLSDYNWARAHNHLVHKTNTQPFELIKRTLNQFNHLAKWLSVRSWTTWLWIRVQLQSLKLQISRLLRARSSLTFKQL